MNVNLASKSLNSLKQPLFPDENASRAQFSLVERFLKIISQLV